MWGELSNQWRDQAEMSATGERGVLAGTVMFYIRLCGQNYTLPSTHIIIILCSNNAKMSPFRSVKRISRYWHKSMNDRHQVYRHTRLALVSTQSVWVICCSQVERPEGGIYTGIRKGWREPWSPQGRGWLCQQCSMQGLTLSAKPKTSLDPITLDYFLLEYTTKSWLLYTFL